MTADRFLPVLVCACCIVALGVSATTLESSLSTSPDDVIDVEFDELPIGQESLSDVKEQAAQKGKPDSTSDPSETDSGANSDGESQERSQAPSEDGDSSGPGGGPPSLLDRLLSLLYSLLVYAAVTLAIGLAAAAGYRYRDRIRDRLAGLWPDAERAGESLWVHDDAQPYTEDASNPIHHAWLQLIERAGIDDPHAHSPRESAKRAVANGLPRDSVEQITREFEAVRYGPAEPTPDRIDRVESELGRIERLGPDTRGGRSDDGDASTTDRDMDTGHNSAEIDNRGGEMGHRGGDSA